MFTTRFGVVFVLAAIGDLILSTASVPMTMTSTFTAQVAITASCTINSASVLDFGSQGVLSEAVDRSSTLEVQCSRATPYIIALDQGTGPGATVDARELINGSTAIIYSLYQDVAHSTVWGNTIGINTVAATGNGGSQSYVIYGEIPPQDTPPPGTYTDTVRVTVAY
jgi:spore coat protein U-like protein